MAARLRVDLVIPQLGGSLLDRLSPCASRPQGYFWFWHIADVPLVRTNVCFEGKNRHDAVVTPFPLMTQSGTPMPALTGAQT
jgi:hypothetical protein